MFNALDAFLQSKQKYLNERGGKPDSRTGKYVPNTTWKDVLKFGAVFLFKTSPEAVSKCQKTKVAQQQPTWSLPKWMQTSGLGLVSLVDPTSGPGAYEEQCGRFQETSSYRNARAAFERTFPFVKLYQQNPVTAPALLGTKLQSNEEYPWNEEFWRAAGQYAIARNAAGMVQGSWDLAVESAREALVELPAHVVGALSAVMPSFPSFNMKKLILWSILGLGGWLIYKTAFAKEK